MGSYDVVIIGAGVCGGWLAKRLEESGRKVLVVEQEQKVLPKDSGIVSRRIEKYVPKTLIKNRIKYMQLVSPSGTTAELRSEDPFAYILRRGMFSEWLRKGYDIAYERPWKIHIFSDSVYVWTTQGHYKCKMVVGADGAASFVRGQLGIQSPSTVFGIFSQEKPFKGDIQIFLNKFFSPEFFAWSIPQSGEHGLISATRPKEFFDHFSKTVGFEYSKVYCSPMPYGLCKSAFNRCLLVGDACGQSKPITGGGIIFGLECADHAFEAIDKAIELKDFRYRVIGEYEKNWRHALWREMQVQFMLRKIYRKMTNADIDDMMRFFADDINNLDNFDYDMLSSEYRKTPKWKLAKALIRYLPMAL